VRSRKDRGAHPDAKRGGAEDDRAMTTSYDDPMRDVEAVEQALDPDFGKKTLLMMTPRGFFGGVQSKFAKAFLVLLYPFWLPAALFVVVLWYIAYGILWVLFSPIRIWAKRRQNS
jgi:YggT family protein